MRRWRISGLLIIAILLLPIHAYADEVTPHLSVQVQLHEELIAFPDAQPYKDEHHRIQVPLRFVSEQLGYRIEWAKVESKFLITLIDESNVIQMETDSPIVVHNGEMIELDTTPVYREGRVYVPLRFLAELCGLSATWDNDNYVAIIHEADVPAVSAYVAPQWKVLDHVTAYAYTSEPDGKGGFKAKDYSGYDVGLGTIAVDPEVIPLGSTLYIEGYDYEGLPAGGMLGRATDIGGSIKGNKIDIFIPEARSKVRQFGIQTVKVYILQD